MTASAATAEGIQDVPFGTSAVLKAPGGSVLAKAEDGKGLSFVELWLTTKKSCGGTIQGPGLARAPERRTEGNVTDTSAPSSLTAAYDIDTQPLAEGCTYEFEIWGKAANAATNPVVTTTPTRC